MVVPARGLAVAVGLTIVALRRRRQCSLRGAGKQWRRLALLLAVAVATYAALDVATTVGLDPK